MSVLCKFIGFVWIYLWLIQYSQSNENVKMTLVDAQSFHGSVNFAVKSRIYSDFFPHFLFVTTRSSGLSVFDIQNPKKPELIAQWNESLTVEGQDIKNGVFVIIDLSESPALWVLDISQLEEEGKLETIGHVRMPSGVCSLHVNLFENRNGLYAVVSNNGHFWKDGHWNVHHDVKPTGIVIVDLIDPQNPKIASVLALDHVSLPEGVLVISGTDGTYSESNFVLVGGYGGPYAAFVDISDVYHPVVWKEWTKPYFCELNSLTRKSKPGFVYSALYGSPGGLVVFNISFDSTQRGRETNPVISEVSHLANSDLSSANRVNMHPFRPLLFMPLESSAGVGVVDVSDSLNLKQVGLTFVPGHEKEKVFCLAVHPNGECLYAFGAYSNKMFIYSIDVFGYR